MTVLTITIIAIIKIEIMATMVMMLISVPLCRAVYSLSCYKATGRRALPVNLPKHWTISAKHVLQKPCAGWTQLCAMYDGLDLAHFAVSHILCGLAGKRQATGSTCRPASARLMFVLVGVDLLSLFSPAFRAKLGHDFSRHGLPTASKQTKQKRNFCRADLKCPSQPLRPHVPLVWADRTSPAHENCLYLQAGKKHVFNLHLGTVCVPNSADFHAW